MKFMEIGKFVELLLIWKNNSIFLSNMDISHKVVFVTWSLIGSLWKNVPDDIGVAMMELDYIGRDSVELKWGHFTVSLGNMNSIIRRQ